MIKRITCLRGDILPIRKEGQAIFSWNPNCFHCIIPGCKAIETVETKKQDV
jgi:hypothetical protein